MNIKRTWIAILIIFVVAAALVGGYLLSEMFIPQQSLQLKLRGSRDIFLPTGNVYSDPGFVATLLSDGTSQQIPVTVTGDTVDTGKLGAYYLKYTARWEDRVVTDYRRVLVVDKEAPVLQLAGAQNYQLAAGQPYGELGFTATDNYDGDLSQQVQVKGSVDHKTPGEYVLHYQVEDASGNTAYAERTVWVEERDPENNQITFSTVPNGKVIYLTFDDGPSKHTPRLLDVLKKYGVKATFFVVNTGYIDTIGRIAAEGHTLAMHTATHVYKEIYASEEAYFRDLNTIREAIRQRTGQESNILRFPGGSSNKSSSFNKGIMTRLTALVQEKGYTYFDWTIDSKDTGGAKTPQQVFQNVVTGVSKEKKSYSIVLQHDIKGYSVDAVESIIVWGLSNGYTFLPLEESSPQCHHRLRN